MPAFGNHRHVCGVATVWSSQGSQALVVIPTTAARRATFLSEHGQQYAALSRPPKGLVVVGNVTWHLRNLTCKEVLQAMLAVSDSHTLKNPHGVGVATSGRPRS